MKSFLNRITRLEKRILPPQMPRLQKIIVVDAPIKYQKLYEVAIDGEVSRGVFPDLREKIKMSKARINVITEVQHV